MPGLLEYLEENFSGAKLDKQTLDIKLIDLDQEPDGVKEILVGVNDFSYNCGNRGCDYHVLRRDGADTLTSIFSMITFDLVPTVGFTNGYRNLTTASRLLDHPILRFDGTTYEVSGQTVLEYIEATNHPAGDWPRSVSGRCSRNGTWFGYADPVGATGNPPSGSASFGNCGDGEHWFTFQCTPGSDDIQWTIEDTIPNARDGQEIQLEVRVDGQSFSLDGKARFTEFLGGVQPVLSFAKGNGFIAALKSGTTLRFTLGNGAAKIHLNGSGNALAAMEQGCDPAIAAIASTQGAGEQEILKLSLDEDGDGDGRAAEPTVSMDDPVAACDRLASGPVEEFFGFPPVPFLTLREHADLAVEACTKAVEIDGDDPRFAYQLARSIVARDHNDTSAVEWFRRAAIVHFAPAVNAMGAIYDKGFGVERDSVKAHNYFEAAYRAKYPPAFANYGSYYMSIGNPEGGGDYARAVEIFQEGVERGDAVSMTYLGNAYWGAFGVAEDYELALQLYEQAVAAGDAFALDRLADHNGSNGQYEKYQTEAIEKGNRMVLLLKHLYGSGEESRQAILNAVNMESYNTKREGGLLYRDTASGDHDHGLFWSIMFASRQDYSKWADEDYVAFMAPIKQRHECVDGQLYLVRNGVLGCAR